MFLSLVSYKFLILNLSLTITFIKLGTFFASKSQGVATPIPESVRGGANVLRPPLYPPLHCTDYKHVYIVACIHCTDYKHVYIVRLQTCMEIYKCFVKITSIDVLDLLCKWFLQQNKRANEIKWKKVCRQKLR